MNSGEPLVSIVVNSFNPKGDARIRSMTEFALRCYRSHTAVAHELVLVDGHAEPDPALAAVCAQLGYRYLNHGRKLAFAEGYNAGAKESRAPWVVLAANDIFVVQGWLEALLAAAEETGAWMTSPYLTCSDYPPQRRQYVVSCRTYAPNYLTLNLNLISRHCIEKIGLLDEQFSGCFNDVDYVLRIRAAGGEIALADCGEVTHLGSATLSKPSLTAMYEKDLPRFEAKWPGLWDTDALRLRPSRGWMRMIDAFVRLVPTRWRSGARRCFYRWEPVLSPKLSRETATRG
jgi:GT2 family glycosyltransferase